MVAPARRLFAVGTFLLLVVLFLVPATLYADGDSPDAVTIGDFVWREGRYAHDGIQQPGEPGLPYAPVNLLSATTGELISVTNANNVGIYSLPADSLAGDYIIEMPNPSHGAVIISPPSTTGPGLLVSPQDQGVDDTLDSDIDPSFRGALVSIGATNDTSIDAGVYDHPNTITYCTGKQLTLTDWTDTFSLLKADPSLGTLIGAYVRVTTGMNQDVTITNSGGSTQNFNYAGGVRTSVALPTGAPLEPIAEKSMPGLVLAGGQSTTLQDLVQVSMREVTIPPLLLSQYRGNGGFDDYFSMNAASFGRSLFEGGGNLVAVAQTRSYATVCVTYVFDAPLAVTLNSFEAQCRADSEIDVAWETAQESDMLGFNVLRAVSAEGTPEQVNSELIPAQAPGGSGGNYLWQDASLSESGEYFYWLDAVEIDGSTERFGPVSAAIPCAPTAVTVATLESGSAAPIAPALTMLGVALAGLVALRLRRR